MRSSPIVFDLVIQGGTLITASEQFEADLAFLDGKIAAIGTQLRGHETVDARGQLVLPGAVDVHVHLEMPVGATVSSDDWQRGTVAAAHGGTTTVVDFVQTEPEE
jgi:dihydropyrimidinase